MTADDITMVIWGLDDPGPGFEVCMVCKRCGTEISARTFDVTMDKIGDAVAQAALADAALGLAHEC